MSTVLVRMRVKPEAEAEFLRILKDVTDQVAEGEPDALVYATWKTERPHEYVMVEAYRTPAGREYHNERHSAVAAAFFATLDGPPEVETLGDAVFTVPR